MNNISILIILLIFIIIFILYNNINKLLNINYNNIIELYDNNILYNVKFSKLVNKYICIHIKNELNENKILSSSSICNLCFTNTITSDNKFKIISGLNNPTNISIYHPNTNRYLYIVDNKLKMGNLNLLNPKNKKKATFKLIYKGCEDDYNKNNNLNGQYYIATSDEYNEKYLNNNKGNVILSKKMKTPINIYDYFSYLKKLDKIYEKNINRYSRSETFIDKSLKTDKKKTMLGIINKLISNKDSNIELIESFDNNILNKFNPFKSHLDHEYKKLFKLYENNALNNDIKLPKSKNILNHLENMNNKLVNNNIKLQNKIDSDGLLLNNEITDKLQQLKTLILSNKALNYFSLNNDINICNNK